MTRITIVTDTDTITLRDDYRWKHHIHAIKKNGITGLFGTPGMKESTTSIPQQDGDYWPSRITQKPRSISLDCVIRGLSSAEAAQERDRINALFGHTLTIIEETAAGPRQLTGMEGTGFRIRPGHHLPRPVEIRAAGHLHGVRRRDPLPEPRHGGHVAKREDIGACDLADIGICRASRAMAGRRAESGIGFPGHDTQRGHCHL